MTDSSGQAPRESDHATTGADYASLTRAELVRLVEQGQRSQAKLEQLGIDLVARTLEAEAAMMAKTRFLSSVTHELRTPLHTILGYVRLLIGESDGESRRQLVIVERSATQLLRLINDLLQHNTQDRKVSVPEPEPMSLDGLIDQVSRSAEHHASLSNARFNVSISAGLPGEIEADEGRLFQVLDNLVGNACKYARAGSVTLCVSCSPVAGENHGPRADRCRLHFSVSDTGIGIPPDDMQKIFMPFSRGSNAATHPGVGLGLSIAQQWVEAMGGKLELESRVGQGSRFHFAIEVPIVRSEPVQATDRPALMLLSLPSRDIEQLREMVALGRVIRLAQWAEALSEVPGSNRLLLGQIARLARDADLYALRLLVSKISVESK
jgi:signal transduction histidine kinase